MVGFLHLLGLLSVGRSTVGADGVGVAVEQTYREDLSRRLVTLDSELAEERARASRGGAGEARHRRGATDTRVGVRHRAVERELAEHQVIVAKFWMSVSLDEQLARFKERDHRRAGGGTRDEKLAQKIIEKLSRRKGFVTAALKRWDEEQQVFVPASSGGANGGGGAATCGLETVLPLPSSATGQNTPHVQKPQRLVSGRAMVAWVLSASRR